MIQVEFCNQSGTEVEQRQLIAGACAVLNDAGLERAQLSLAVVDDPAMHALNRRHLEHDYPTDVLSFLLDSTETTIEGEVIVSVDTAAREAAEYGWGAADELLLYVIHGTLHLVGYDDKTENGRKEMRLAEARHLAGFGLTPPWDDAPSDSDCNRQSDRVGD